MMNRILFIYIAVVLSVNSSCGEKPKPKDPNPVTYKEPLIESNMINAQKESDQINIYVKQHKYDSMKTSGTGLRYMIYKKGMGVQASNGMMARVTFKISLLDGRECYSSDKAGPKEFLVGQDHVESGLHEAIQYMRVGDKAIVIMPSHLAFGLVGDEDKIPPRSSVVYDLELLSLR